MSMITGINSVTASRLVRHGYAIVELSTGEILISRGGHRIATRFGHLGLEAWATRLVRKFEVLRAALVKRVASERRAWHTAIKRSLAERGAAIDVAHSELAETCLTSLAVESNVSISGSRVEHTFHGEDDGNDWCVVLVQKRVPLPPERSNVIPFRRRV